MSSAEQKPKKLSKRNLEQLSYLTALSHEEIRKLYDEKEARRIRALRRSQNLSDDTRATK